MNSVRPSWEQYFISLAETVSTRSPDPKTKVGAVLVGDDNRIISTGFNGFIPGFPDTSVNWENREWVREHIIHAEMNCILFASSKFENARLYTTLSPCSNCLKHLAASGVKEIVFKHPYTNLEQLKPLAEMYRVIIRQA